MTHEKLSLLQNSALQHARGWWWHLQVIIPFHGAISGLLVGWLSVRWNKLDWHLPEFERVWLVVFLVTRLLAFDVPATRNTVQKTLVESHLIISKLGLFLFCLLNRHLLGTPILAAGLFLNLLVNIANGGLMPHSTLSAKHLVPLQVLANIKVGGRVSPGSKDILLPPGVMVFPGWLTGLVHRVGSQTALPSIWGMF